MDKIHLAVVGSRFYPNRGDVASYFRKLVPKERFHILSGGAEGVDSWADDEAHKLGIPCTLILPSDRDFEVYPPEMRPLKRNERVVQHCDMLVAFWAMDVAKTPKGMMGSGTVHVMKLAYEAKKLLKVITPWGVLRPEVAPFRG